MAEALARKLAAILAADIAGYSALVSSNEAQTVSDLRGHQAVVLPMLRKFVGRLIDTAGDGILAEFASVVKALECAVAIQRTMALRNITVEASRRMQFRMGIHIGDVFYDSQRVYGHSVNIAARLEGIAEPGCIYVSRQVHDEIEGKLALGFRSLGKRKLKNIHNAIEVFVVEGAGDALDAAEGAPTTRPTPQAGKPMVGAAPEGTGKAGDIKTSAQRRLLAVMSANVVGYEGLMRANKDSTHARMARLGVAVINPSIAEHRGRIVSQADDSFVATFDSATDAAGCAIALQHGFARIGKEPAAPPIQLRVGLNVADVISEPNGIFGDGVNLAARLQAIAQPGGFVVSSMVAEQLRSCPGIELADLGEHELKNIRHPVRAYGIRARGVAVALPPPELPEINDDRRPSIAVLPLRQSPPDPDEAYFADGVIEGIIHVLAGLPELFVISHGSMAAFVGGEIDANDVGRMLGVRYVVDGTVRRAGEHLRVTTRLIDVELGSLLRGSRFDGTVSDVFEIQDRVSADVVATIAPSVRLSELRRAVRKPPESLTSYDCVLRALDLMPRLDHGCFDGAGELLRKAVDIDPAYAPAWSYLALWHLIRLAQGWTPSAQEDVTEAGRAANAALAHDPRNSTALAIRGHFLSYTQRDYIGAASLLEQAVTLGPNNPMTWSLSSATSGYRGEGGRAVHQAQQALRLSPIDPFAYLSEYLLGQAHYIAGNFVEAIRIGRRVAARNGMHAANLRTLAASLSAAGDIQDAQNVAKRLLAINPMFRLSVFAERTPLTGAILDDFCKRLRTAGLPD